MVEDLERGGPGARPGPPHPGGPGARPGPPDLGALGGPGPPLPPQNTLGKSSLLDKFAEFMIV